MGNLVQRIKGYKLNSGALDDLRESGAPEDVLAMLRSLQDQQFSSRSQFVWALNSLAAGSALSPHQERIVACARVWRPRRIARYVGSYWNTLVARSRFVRPLYDYLMLRPVVLSIRLRLRWWLFSLLARLRGRPPIRHAVNANIEGFVHNRNQVLSFLEGHRNRTESLMNVLRSIQGVDLRSARVLCIGPRNEAEVLLLLAYGCKRNNVQAIDLFSYSPLIRLMDMNTLEYADDSFDIYYSSAVIKYSPDIRRTVAESLRVTRPGGVMVFGFMFGETSDIIPKGSELHGGVRDLLALYGGHVEHVFWHEEFPSAPGDTRAGTIFRIRK
jgi:SAM-dependent methyltransferase